MVLKEGNWDIVVDGDGTVGVNNLHTDKGIIYNASPNPFSNQLNIHYGVFRESMVGLMVFDLQGQAVATLEERKLTSGKYEASWVVPGTLPGGYYFIVLKVNDLQVHYKKVLLKN